MKPDSELLRLYAQTDSESAFAELVRRHLNLVYSAALRQVAGNATLAQDVAQTVFTDLARKANSFSRRETLTGWLYTSAHFAAAKMVRTENRRREREKEFMREPIHETPLETDWGKIGPALDDAMHELKETDRGAILLRYFENRQFGEVGAKLGLNENAARMRVERALEKLRAIFAKRGVTTATAFASVISANAIQIAPANLAATLTTASIAAAGTGTFTLLKIMTATKLKFVIGAIVVVGAATAFLHQQQAQNRLHGENEALRQRIAQLQTDNENFSKHLASIRNSKSLPDEQLKELLRLRGDVGMLREKTNEMRKLRGEYQQLRLKNAAQLQFPTLPAEDQFTLDKTHVGDAMSLLITAVKSFADKNNGEFPTNFDWLVSSGQTTNFAGNIRLNDFVFLAPGTVGFQGRKLILRNRVPVKDAKGNSIWIYGSLDKGIPSTEITTALYGNLESDGQ